MSIFKLVYFLLTITVSDNLNTVDRLYHELTVVPTLDYGPARKLIIFDKRKYYHQAVNYEKALVLAAEGKNYPSFRVDLVDISISLKRELVSIPGFQLQNVLRQAILRIYKDIDGEHNEFLPKPHKPSNLRSYMTRSNLSTSK